MSHLIKNLKSSSRIVSLSASALLLPLTMLAHAQDSSTRSRKYTPPPPTAKISVSVIKDTNGKPVENAAVIFHMTGEEGKGNMELKTNEEGKAAIDVVPIGDTMTLQIIANGFQTFGEDYKITSDSKEIIVRLKRPARQYSTYEHAANSGSSSSSSSPQNSTQESSDKKPNSTPPAPQ
jgi:hypothetical protein